MACKQRADGQAKIAALIDPDGRMVDFFESGMLRVFSRDHGGWRKAADHAVGLNGRMPLKELQSELRKIGEMAAGCDCLMVRSIRGAASAMLEDMGVRILCAGGMAEDYLEPVFRIAATSPPAGPDAAGLPDIEVRDGKIRVALHNVLQNDPSRTSAEVLLPVLRDAAFKELEVVCEHVPRWLAATLRTLHMRMDVEGTNDHLLRVTITPSGEGASGPSREPPGGGFTCSRRCGT